MSPRISYSFYPHREVSLDLTDEIVKELVVSVTKDERPVAERGFDWIAVRGYHADDEFDWDSGTISFRVYQAWFDSAPDSDETRPPALLRTKDGRWAVWTNE